MLKILRLNMLLFAIVQNAAAFDWTLSIGNYFTSFNCTLDVPEVPHYTPGIPETFFLWPGLQTNSRSANYLPIGFGVLQPVLTFGPSCQNHPPIGNSSYRGWYVSGLYVNPSGTVAGKKGCLSGPIMDVTPGDALVMHMYLVGTTWVQTVTRTSKSCSAPAFGTNTASGCQVSYSIDMLGQAQTRAELVIELYFNAVVTFPVIFRDISLKTFRAESPLSTAYCLPTSYYQKTEVCYGLSLDQTGTFCKISSCVFTPTVTSIVTTMPAIAINESNIVNSPMIPPMRDEVPAEKLPPPPAEISVETTATDEKLYTNNFNPADNSTSPSLSPQKAGLSTGAIVAIGLAWLILVAIGVLVFVKCIRKPKSPKSESVMSVESSSALVGKSKHDSYLVPPRAAVSPSMSPNPMIMAQLPLPIVSPFSRSNSPMSIDKSNVPGGRSSSPLQLEKSLPPISRSNSPLLLEKRLQSRSPSPLPIEKSTNPISRSNSPVPIEKRSHSRSPSPLPLEKDSNEAIVIPPRVISPYRDANHLTVEPGPRSSSAMSQRSRNSLNPAS